MLDFFIFLCMYLRLKKTNINRSKIAIYNVQSTGEASSLKGEHPARKTWNFFTFFYSCHFFSIAVGHFLPSGSTIDESGSNRPKSTRIRIYNTEWNTSNVQRGTDPWQWCPAGLACRSPRSIDLMMGGRAVSLQHRVLTPLPGVARAGRNHLNK
jgi:hypothetical protein